VSCELNFDCEVPAGDLRIEFCIFVDEVVNQIKLCVIFMVKSRIESNLCDWIESNLCAVNVLWIGSNLCLWWNWTCIFVWLRSGASGGEVEAGGAGSGRSRSCWCQAPARGALFCFSDPFSPGSFTRY
jgi:hypothetical protein